MPTKGPKAKGEMPTRDMNEEVSAGGMTPMKESVRPGSAEGSAPEAANASAPQVDAELAHYLQEKQKKGAPTESSEMPDQRMG